MTQASPKGIADDVSGHEDPFGGPKVDLSEYVHLTHPRMRYIYSPAELFDLAHSGLVKAPENMIVLSKDELGGPPASASLKAKPEYHGNSRDRPHSNNNRSRNPRRQDRRWVPAGDSVDSRRDQNSHQSHLHAQNNAGNHSSAYTLSHRKSHHAPAVGSEDEENESEPNWLDISTDADTGLGSDQLQGMEEFEKWKQQRRMEESPAHMQGLAAEGVSSNPAGASSLAAASLAAANAASSGAAGAAGTSMSPAASSITSATRTSTSSPATATTIQAPGVSTNNSAALAAANAAAAKAASASASNASQSGFSSDLWESSLNAKDNRNSRFSTFFTPPQDAPSKTDRVTPGNLRSSSSIGGGGIKPNPVSTATASIPTKLGMPSVPLANTRPPNRAANDSTPPPLGVSPNGSASASVAASREGSVSIPQMPPSSAMAQGPPGMVHHPSGNGMQGVQMPPPGMQQMPPPGMHIPQGPPQGPPQGMSMPPPGMQVPPGMQAPPPGMQVPPLGMQMPPLGMQAPPGMQAPSGMQMPPGMHMPPGMQMPPGMVPRMHPAMYGGMHPRAMPPRTDAQQADDAFFSGLISKK